MNLIESINRTRELAGMKPLSEAQTADLLPEAADFDAFDELSEMIVEANDDEAKFVQDFLEKEGIHSKSAIKSVWELAKQHHAEANRIAGEVKMNTIMAGEKVLSSKEFFKIVTALRKALANRRSSAPVEAGTRFIMTVTDTAVLDKVKAFVKAYNKEHKDDKIKLGIYDRPANKEIKSAHKKLWIDGSAAAVAAVKKEFA